MISEVCLAYTENGTAVVVVVQDNQRAIDCLGYIYNWEDGYATMKSSEPSIETAKEFKEEFLKWKKTNI